MQYSQVMAYHIFILGDPLKLISSQQQYIVLSVLTLSYVDDSPLCKAAFI